MRLTVAGRPIAMRGFDITSPGGGDASAVRKDPPLQPEKYQPRYNGERPSWGWFVRHAQGVTWENCTLAVEKSGAKSLTGLCGMFSRLNVEEVVWADPRVAIVLDDVEGAAWLGGRIEAQKGASGCQLLARGVERAELNGTGLRACPWAPSAG